MDVSLIGQTVLVVESANLSHRGMRGRVCDVSQSGLVLSVGGTAKRLLGSNIKLQSIAGGNR